MTEVMTPPRPPEPEHGGASVTRRRVARVRRRSRLRRAAGWSAGVIVGAAVLGLVANVVGTAPLSAARPPALPAAGSARDDVSGLEQHPFSTALVGTTAAVRRRAPRLAWVALLSHDGGGDSGSIIYVPAHTAAEVPGRGLRSLADAYASGGLSLLLVSTENLLDIDIDRYLELSDREAATLFGSVGPLSVDVPADVRVAERPGAARLMFTAGLQEVTGEYVAQLLYAVGLDGGETELGTRHLAFWDALMKRFGPEPAALEDAVADAAAVLGDSNATPAHNADLLATMASIDDADMTLGVLPVRDVGAG